MGRQILIPAKSITHPDIGFFSWSYMPYEHEYDTGFSTTPTLTEMTKAAVNYLNNKSDENGFFLMVEGGLIDHAHHGSEVSINNVN